MPGLGLAFGVMAKRRRTFFTSPRLIWPAALLVAVLDAGGLYLLVSGDASEAAPEARPMVAPAPPIPVKPPPPAMIHPPAVADVLNSGTLIVISKASQHMYVFSDGALWASTPISTGKRRHETPSGVFPILQKRKFHRSNIYSNAPMPFMQRLTWDGIALHAGWVPGYPASHGCVRVPRAFAQSLFKLTNASATTVVIGDDPLETELHAQQFALTAQLPVRSALAPPADPPAADLAMLHPPAGNLPVVELAAAQVRTSFAIARLVPSLRSAGGQTIQLAAAASRAEAEAHWARLRATRPDLSRFAMSVEPATVNSRRVYRLRISGADAHDYCLKLKSEGVSCLNVG